MLLLILGCTPVSIDQEPIPPGPPPATEETEADTEVDTASPEDDPPEDDTEDTGVESIEGAGSDDSWIFNPEQVHTLDISISEENIEILNAGTEAYSQEVVWVEVDVSYDDIPMPSVGLRLKGRWGSWRSFEDKPSIKVDFNRYVDGQELEGLEGLTLNNMISDCSFMREHMAYPVYAAMGVPVPRTAYVWITVNGEDYGLYINVESIDDVFLDRHYADGNGNLYDADYILWDDGTYTVLDFYSYLIQFFEQEEGDDVAGQDLSSIATLLDTWEGSESFYEETSAVIDWDHHQRMVAAEMWIGQNDGYSLNRNNYLVYFEPKSLLTIQPWDHDYAFLNASDWGFSWTNPQGRLTNLCLSDPACRADQIARIEEVIEVVDALGFDDRFDDTRSMINDYITADTRRECSDSYVNWYQGVIESWSYSRSGELRTMWGL